MLPVHRRKLYFDNLLIVRRQAISSDGINYVKKNEDLKFSFKWQVSIKK